MGVFSVSVTSMTQIFHQLQNILAEVEVPQETHLFEIQQQARRYAHAHIRTCAHVHKRHICKIADIESSTHTPNKHSAHLWQIQ